MPTDYQRRHSLNRWAMAGVALAALVAWLVWSADQTPLLWKLSELSNAFALGLFCLLVTIPPYLVYRALVDWRFAQQNGIDFPRARFFPLWPALISWLMAVGCFYIFLSFGFARGGEVYPSQWIQLLPFLALCSLALALATYRHRLNFVPNVRVGWRLLGALVGVYLWTSIWVMTNPMHH